MSGLFLLDFSALAISLFVALVLLWLGLTVLLNAERRTGGVFLAVTGLLVGAAFFVSHAVVISQGAKGLLRSFGFWWQAGWLPVIAAPYLWYLLMLWYSGYWDDERSPLHRRQRLPLALSLVYAGLLSVSLLSYNPLSGLPPADYTQAGRLPALGPSPVAPLFYPPFIIFCIALALDALLRPAPSGRVMGDLARRRARPWLVGASSALLLVSLMVGGLVLWLVGVAWPDLTIAGTERLLTSWLAAVDLALAAVLMVAILMLGQALVSYEIFTGKTLPRAGFQLQWRTTVVLLALLSLAAAWGVARSPGQISLALVLLGLAAGSYALFSWQSYREREHSIRQLRPFTSSQRLVERILTPEPEDPPELDLAAPFRALCQDVLGASQAILLPQGSLAALVSSPLRYPPTAAFDLPPLPDLAAQFTSPQMIGRPLEPDATGGAVWAAPLWSERGLIGLLVLGEKLDGGFYSLEEIELARSTGERLADILASAEMARRLVALQRQRLAESAVLDRQTRRVLHDEVLPRLHTALLELSSLPPEAPLQEALNLITTSHRTLSNLLRDLPAASAPDLVRLGLVAALRRVLSEELPNSFDAVDWQIDPQAEQAVQALPPLAAEVVYYAAREALRNAARHARPPGDGRALCLMVRLEADSGEHILTIEDNGIGLPAPGQPPNGNGQGLALHSTLMAVIGGSLSLESTPGEFTRVVLCLPKGVGFS